MTVVTQPAFITEFGDLLGEVLSAEQLPDLLRVSSLLSAGVPVVGGSDRPVVQGSPLLGIQAMVERRSAGGRVHGPDERVDAATALAVFTAGGARAANSEHLYGRIAPRLRADLVVRPRDSPGENVPGQASS